MRRKLYYAYDGLGYLFSITHTNASGKTVVYAVQTNSRGDVKYIYDTNATLLCEYEYDAWGNVLTIKDGNGNLITDENHIAHINPIRYRGYYFDVETGLYYLNSRYYDAEVRRFISADGYISTGQGAFGFNMYAYCGNNPVNRADSTGQFWEELKTFVTGIVNAVQSNALAYAGCAGITAVDGPLPFADIVAAAAVSVLAIVAVGKGINAVAQAKVPKEDKAEEKTKDVAITLEPKKSVIFPVNPNNFNPVGLIKIPRVGTKNGAFISWMDPITNKEVFRWDENPKRPNGPHYHIYGAGHYYSGMIVPEPYATIYFPFG